jgi:hypothetical protein
MKLMSASQTLPAFTQQAIAGQTTSGAQVGMRRRQISTRTGRALEILGHSIEYLADEFANDSRSYSVSDGRLEAIQLLMAINRTIYLECPEVPSFRERVSGWFRRKQEDSASISDSE